MFEIARVGEGITHIEADVRDAARLSDALAQAQPDVVFHLAAQAIVRLAYEQPRETLDVNVMGTANLLEAVRAYASKGRPCTVVVITSDKCYENREWVHGYRETDRLGGNDPYSMSKAAAELVVASWRRTFFPAGRIGAHGVRLATARAGNVIGGGDWAADRLLPDCIAALTEKRPIAVRNPDAVRPWQHVLEPLGGYLHLGARLMASEPLAAAQLCEAWNFGPTAGSVWSVRQMVDRLVTLWGGATWKDCSEPDAPHEAKWLALSSDKAFHRLGWEPVWDVDTALVKTVAWASSWASRNRRYARRNRASDRGVRGRCRRCGRGLGGRPGDKECRMTDKRAIRARILELVRDYYEADAASRPGYEAGQGTVRYAGRNYDADEMVNLVDASLDFWLTAGRYADRFEAGLASYLGVDTALLVNSGSSANLVAFSSLTSPKLKDRRVRPGDEVVTVAAGFPTTVNPILQNQAVPVFVDVELGTYVPTLESIERAIGPRTRAIMIAHTMGVPYPARELRELCDRRGLWLVEDNCDALGSRYDGRLTGTFGHLASFSFYPAHHITTGEGGAVATDDAQLARIARSFRDWGRDCHCVGGANNTCGKRFGQQFGTLPFGYDHKYVYTHIGYNLKLTDMQAAIGVAQLAKLPAFHRRPPAAARHVHRRAEPLRRRPDSADNP